VSALAQTIANSAPVGPYLPNTTDWLGRWRARANSSNDYEIDRELQRTKTYTGIPTIQLQDQAVLESMGGVYDRSQEHLGTSDGMIIQVRRKLIETARALDEHGVTPPCVDNPSLYRVRSGSATLPKGAPWYEATRDWLEGKTTDHPSVTTAHSQ
jgi:hypothetical protein